LFILHHNKAFTVDHRLIYAEHANNFKIDHLGLSVDAMT